MRKIKIYTVDAFTNKMFMGNPAGVVINGELLSAAEMLLIAKEINLSETTFLLPAKDNSCDYEIRYFTPAREIDFCGHATIAAAWVLGTQYHKTDKLLRFKTSIGIVSISWLMENNILHAVMTEQVAPKIKEYVEKPEELLETLGLTYSDIDDRYEIIYAYTGNWHLLVPIISREIIERALPDYDRLCAHNKKRNVATTHLFTFHECDGCILFTRDFAPSVGVNEDPVTGSANGALAGYLALKKILPVNSEYKIMQGNSRGRLGILYIKVSVKDTPKISVGGKAVIVLNGEIELKF